MIEPRPTHGTDFRRIEAFSDGVIAIAITLLVLTFLDVDIASKTSGELQEVLLDLGPQLWAYALSFAVIGRFWLVHHRVLDVLARFDGVLVALNMVFLASVVLIPFTSDLLGTEGDLAPATQAYAVSVAMAALASLAMLRYALRRGLVAREHLARVRDSFGTRSAGIAVVFLVSVPIAIWSTLAAQLVWLIGFLVRPGRFIRWRGGEPSSGA